MSGEEEVTKVIGETQARSVAACLKVFFFFSLFLVLAGYDGG
jgi:hypothetical protein